VSARAQPASMESASAGLHVAIIMDGNGRWARGRGLSRIAGHRAGGETLRRIVEASPGLDISTLTLYAFSSDNWKRPASEVAALMRLFERYLADELERCVENGIRVNVIGRRDRLQPALVEAVERMERATAPATRLHLRLAVDYSSRDAILRALRSASRLDIASPREFSGLLNRAIHSHPPAPDVDLLIRTSGEKRLSDFLLWEIAYAELFFTDRRWPDFGVADLATAVAEFRRRERRFGGLREGAPPAR